MTRRNGRLISDSDKLINQPSVEHQNPIAPPSKVVTPHPFDRRRVLAFLRIVGLKTRICDRSCVGRQVMTPYCPTAGRIPV